MRSTIATFKENLSQIALDVQDAAEELEIYKSSSTEDASVADRRISYRFAQSQSPQATSLSNGIDSAFRAEIEQYKAEIRRLQESEAEIKALSVNYAALLKEKEQELSRLNEENGSLRKNSVIPNAVGDASQLESFKTTNATSMPKGTGDKSPSRQQRGNSRHIGNHIRKGVFPKQELLSNGNADASPSDGNQHKMETKLTNSWVSREVSADILEENKSLAAMQAGYEAEIQQLKSELQKERDNLASIMLKLQGESKLNESSQKELHILKMDKEKISMERKELNGELRDKVLEIKRLQFELNRRNMDEDSKELSKNLKDAIAALEEENACLKREKAKLEAALDLSMNKKQDRVHGNNLDSHEDLASGNFAEKKDMSTSIESLTEDFEVACRERDKALQELARLKQHLLDKELEESDKMDEDSKTIEDLRAHCEHQMAQILHLERSLKQAISSHEETKRASSDELQNLNEIINDLKKKLSSYTSIIDSKNTELLNLQTALGQYYAETEAKERLERDLAVAREELAKLSEQLKDANQRMEFAKQQKEEFLAKLSYAEKLLLEGKHAAKKLEEDNLKLRRALEQSMTRLNRMSVESDYLVDRRIVIKLLVTYFQRNHSKEVLDLMVRMLGFSEEDKQRIGFAQQGAGKGIVRGVLGLPGRLVGGMLGSGSPYVSAGQMSSENQSFADLWVDFLLKETEEREKKGTAEVGGASGRAPEGTASAPSISEERTISSSFSSNYQSTYMSASEIPAQQSMFDREFSSVPLTSAASSTTLAESSSSSSSSSRAARLFPRS